MILLHTFNQQLPGPIAAPAPLRPGNVHATLDAHATDAGANEESAVRAAVAHPGHPGDFDRTTIGKP